MKSLKKLFTVLLLFLVGGNVFGATAGSFTDDYFDSYSVKSGSIRYTYYFYSWGYVRTHTVSSTYYFYFYWDTSKGTSIAYVSDAFSYYLAALGSLSPTSSAFSSDTIDTDGDGISDLQELYYNYQAGGEDYFNNLDTLTDATSSVTVESLYNSDLDSDGDGIRDYYEYKAGTDAFTTNTTYSSLMESYNNGNTDSDGTAIDDLTYLLWTSSSANETGYLEPNNMSKDMIISDLSSSDYDMDGISDYDEYIMDSNPFTFTVVADSWYTSTDIGDGVTSTTLTDSDGDGYSDYVENYYGTDSSDSSSTPSYSSSSSSDGSSSSGSSGSSSSGSSSSGSSSSGSSSSGSSSSGSNYGDTGDSDGSGTWEDTDGDGIPDSFEEGEGVNINYASRFDAFQSYLLEKLGLEAFEGIFTYDAYFDYPVYTIEIPIYGEETLSFDIDLEELSEYTFVQIFRSILLLLFVICLFFGLVRFWRTF